jgi:ubiquinone/menaquinone biosynthesis C-methylase UbiE
MRTFSKGVLTIMVEPMIERLPHVSTDMPSRNFKAMKIERLLDLASRPQPIRLLEVGTGSGGIAHYFGTHPQLRCEVDAVDVCDNRLVTSGYRYQQVSDTRLPFADESFDVVLTNHVIEHVGNEQAQRAHLAELHRVLRPDGVGYLAVPNRWMLVEPHYRLAFLSWLPRRLRSRYLRLSGKGAVYDCEPLTKAILERLLANAGLQFDNVCFAALREIIALEGGVGLVAAVMARLPAGLSVPFLPLFPTLCYVVRRQAANVDD